MRTDLTTQVRKMPKCVICEGGARDKNTTNGKPLCECCGAASIADFVVEDSRFRSIQKDLGAALRWCYYLRITVTVASFDSACLEVIAAHKAFEANPNQRDKLAVEALIEAGDGIAEDDPTFIVAVSQAIGRSMEESREYICDLQKRGMVKLVCGAEHRLPEGMKPMVQPSHWERIEG